MEDGKFFSIDVEGTILVCGSREQAEANDSGQVFSSEEELAALIAKWPSQRVLEVYNAMPLKSVTEIAEADAVHSIWKEVSKLPAPRTPGNKSAISKEPVMAKKSTSKKAAKPEVTKAAPAPKKTKAERKAERTAAKAVKKAAAVKAKADKKEAAKKAKADAKGKKDAGKAAKKSAKVAKPKKVKVPKVKTPREPGAPKQPGSSVTPSEKPPRPGSKGEKIINLMLREKGCSIEEIVKVLDHDQHTEKTKADPSATSRGYLSGLRQRYSIQFTFKSIKEEGSKVRRYYAKTAK